MVDRDSRDDFQRIRLGRSGPRWADDNLSGGGVPAFLGRVTTASKLIGVGTFLKVQPLFVLGREVEAGAGQLTPFGSSTVPVYLVGPGLPATGDELVCRFVDNRWAAERMSGATGSVGATTAVLNCICSRVPTALTMTSADPSCNYRMFQSGSIQYAATPDEFASLGLGTACFLGAESFPDIIAGGALFRYLLTCYSTQFNLSRVYAESPYGSPYHDGLLYTWVIGGYGSSCSPFGLYGGQAYPGSDASCAVTIVGS